MSTDIFSSICANINSSLDDLGAFKRSFLYDDMEESSLLSLLTGMTYNRNGGKLGEGDLRPKALFADSTQLAAMIGSPKAAFKKNGLILQGYVFCEKKIPISCMNGSCHVLPDTMFQQQKGRQNWAINLPKSILYWHLSFLTPTMWVLLGTGTILAFPLSIWEKSLS